MIHNNYPIRFLKKVFKTTLNFINSTSLPFQHSKPNSFICVSHYINVVDNISRILRVFNVDVILNKLIKCGTF